MNFVIKLARLSLVATPLLCVPNPASACMCFQPDATTMRDLAVKRSAASTSQFIFEGEVEKQEIVNGPANVPADTLSMTSWGQHRIVTVRILRLYRGQTGGQVLVVTGLGNGDCGFEFETGKQYLVYASDAGGQMFTSICHGTAALEQSGPAVRFLRGEPALADDLLDPAKYYWKYEPRWSAKICGRVTTPDGRALGKADVSVSLMRNEPLPLYSLGDPNLSKRNGRFCIEPVPPGRYLLTAEKDDFDANTRWMGYYPAGGEPSGATPLAVKAGSNISDLKITVLRERLYTVRCRILDPEGHGISSNVGFEIESAQRDALSYHTTQMKNRQGLFVVGFVPAGMYKVRTVLAPEAYSAQPPNELSIWEMAKKDVEITGDSEIVLQLTRK